MATVETGSRIHLGFQNLSLAHERLYGGIGIALESPSTVLRARPADVVSAEDSLAAEYAERAVNVLSVPGATVTVEQSIPRHVGLGSGTQLALGVYSAIARAYDLVPEVYEAAPELGRGGRSGIGVGSFEAGGLLVDAGHPTEQFTTGLPPDGEWTVPPLVASIDLPEHWRVVLVTPDVDSGRNGDRETASMSATVEAARAEIADDVATTLTRRLLPAAAAGDLVDFGDAVSEIERLNGAWYADEQGGVFRPPVGTIVEGLSDCQAVYGTGQSSWGPTVYALTDDAHADAAVAAARNSLSAAGVDGDVCTVRIENDGSL